MKKRWRGIIKDNCPFQWKDISLPELEHIKQDERVYMSQKGDLYFANVEEQDSRNDYCCFAAFPRLRTIVQKMPMKLTVNSCKLK